MAPPGYTAPGYAAPAQQPGMPQYAQSTGITPPRQSPGPGMQWAAFNPGAELFGMGGGIGGLIATRNPNLTGAMIEEGYVIRGPLSNGVYEIIYGGGQGMPAPTNSRGDRVNGRQYTEDELFQGAVIDDKTGRVVFTPPRRRPGSETGPIVAAGIFDVIGKGITATGQVLSERERRKAAKYTGRAYGYSGGGYPAGYGGGYGTGRGLPLGRKTSYAPLVVISLLGAGAVFLAVTGGEGEGEKK